MHLLSWRVLIPCPESLPREKHTKINDQKQLSRIPVLPFVAMEAGIVRTIGCGAIAARSISQIRGTGQNNRLSSRIATIVGEWSTRVCE